MFGLKGFTSRAGSACGFVDGGAVDSSSFLGDMTKLDKVPEDLFCVMLATIFIKPEAISMKVVIDASGVDPDDEAV